MAKTAYTLTLKSGDKLCGTITMESPCAPVLVGRSHRCSLRTPEDDHSVSGVHVRFSWSGRKLMVEDAGSRNGTYCHGLRINKPCKVVSGNTYTLGNCTISCKLDRPASRKEVAVNHKLEYINGDSAGKQIDIVPQEGKEVFSIGLDPGNSLSLPDMLVSRHHAELSVKENGECWIRDLSSRNGTYINGEVLRGKERLLKDNDKISIAYFDFRFLDKAKPHKRFFIWLRVFVVAATLLIMAGVYVSWVTTSQTVESYLDQSRKAAAERDFTSAAKILGSARTARDADRYRAQIDSLDVQIERWANTSENWNQAQAQLAQSRFMDARKTLDSLTSGALDAWVWNGTTAVAEKRKAEFAAKSLRLYYDAEEALVDAMEGQPEHQADNIKIKKTPLLKFIESSKTEFASQTYLAPLTNAMSSTIAAMDGVEAGFTSVDEKIARLDSNNPNFAQLSKELDDVASDKSMHEAVRAYAEKYRQPCAELAEVKSFIAEEYVNIKAMRFDDVIALKEAIRLPKVELCARHPQLSMHRGRLEEFHNDAQTYAQVLKEMVGSLAARGIAKDSCDIHLSHILDEKLWGNALSFDCFSGRPPSTRRSDPCGFYDEFLGVDYTFQSLRALPDNYNEFCLRFIGFTPDVVAGRRAMKYVDSFVAYMNEKGSKLKGGELGKLYKHCLSLQEKRTAVLEYLASYVGDERAKIVAHFYIGYFSPTFDLARRKELSQRFRKVQREVSTLCEEYSAATDPQMQIAIRSKIFAKSFPGDSQIHSKWVQMHEGGGAK